MQHQRPWMEKPLHWVASIWLFAGLAAGGKYPNRLTRIGIGITGAIFTISGIALIAQRDLLWGVPLFVLGAVQIIALVLFYLAGARQTSAR